MPQMAPSNWMILFLIFNMTMMFIIANNHFMPMTKLNQIKLNLSLKNYAWKW